MVKMKRLATQDLYWRVETLDKTKGMSWIRSPSLNQSQKAVPQTGAGQISQQVFYTNTMDERLVALDHPTHMKAFKGKSKATQSNDGAIKLKGPRPPLMSYEIVSQIPSKIRVEALPSGSYLQIRKRKNNKSRAFAKALGDRYHHDLTIKGREAQYKQPDKE